MKIKRSFISLLIIAILLLVLMFAVACEPPVDIDTDEEEESSTTDTQLITNGSFATATSSTGTASYLKDTVTGWTKNNAATLYSDAVMGVIDVSPDVFSAKRETLTDIEINGPGISPRTPKDDEDAYTDTNAMVIGLNDKGSVYYKNSSAVTITSGKYYKLEIDVFTQLLETDTLDGAYIVVNSGLYAVFQALEQSDGWKTYTIYVEANNFENRTFYIELWIGYGPKHIGTQTDADLNQRLTKGYIFFDNVTLTDITDDDGATTYKNASDRLGGEGVYETEAVISLYYPDETFTYYKAYTYSSYTSNSKYYYGVKPGMHNNYTVIVGGSDISSTSDFPLYDSQTSTSGMVDMAQLYKRVNNGTEEAPAYEFTDSLKSLVSTFRAPERTEFFDDEGVFGFYSAASGDTVERSTEGLKDTTALMIYHPDFAISGAGMKSSQQFMIEKHKYYDISVWVYVWVPKFDTAEPVKESTVVYDEPQRTSYEDSEAGQAVYEAALATYNSESNQQKIKDYNAKVVAWLESRNNYAEAIREGSYKAEFRLTGTSVDTGSLVETTVALPYVTDSATDPDGNYPYVPGGWQKLTFKIRGNELSDKKVNFEFWYGEGEWQSDGLMVGGAIFDDISITIGDNPYGASEDSDYEVVSPISLEQSEEFGLIQNDGTDGIFGDEKSDFVDYTNNESSWEFAFVDKKSDKASAVAGLIYGVAATDEERWQKLLTDVFGGAEYDMPYGNSPIQVTLDGADAPTIFDILTLQNIDYSATTFKYLPKTTNEDGEEVNAYKTILRNNFYRISLWVRTDGIATSQGVNIGIYDNTDTSLSSLSTINTDGEWLEIAFLVRGSTLTDTEYYLGFDLGSGDIYTPSSHVKGAVYITAILISEISYTEYNSASTDTYTAKKQISDLPSTTDSITNGYFSDLSTSNYETSDGDAIIFDKETGLLVGVATPNSWTLSSAANAITAPANLTISTATEDDDSLGLKTGDQYLTWKYITGGVAGDSLDPKVNLVYLIYLDGAEWADPDDPEKEPEKKDNVLIGRVPQPTSGLAPIFKINVFNTGNFKVRAAYLPETLPAYDSGTPTGISAYSTTLKNSATEPENYQGDDLVDYTDEFDIKATSFGVIDYINYSNAELLGLTSEEERIAFYKKSGVEGLQYASGFADTLLMLHSDYYTRGGYTASSTSLSSESYYMLAVWVKTLNGAKASITINNTSKIFTDTSVPGSVEDGDYVGYINVDTNGEWVQYRFYMQTLVSAASFQLELFLGNKYAEGYAVKDDSGTTSYTVMHGLSKGTVFFDDIAFKTLTKDQYDAYVYGGDPEEIEEDDYLEQYTEYPLSSLDDVYANFTNNYQFRLLDYTTDSFDIFTAASTSYPSQGGTPNDYTHYVASTGTDYDSAAEDEGSLAMIYGVYDKRKINTSTEVVGSIMASNADDGNKATWLGDASADDIVNFLTDNTGNGNHYLLMANLIQNGQYYLSQTTLSLAANSYYKVTFHAKTWFQDENSYAEFRFEYGNDTTQWSTIRIYGNHGRDAVTEYVFYVYNADTTNSVSSNKISFHLGTNSNTSTSSTADNFFRGILLLDDISIEKLGSSDEYDEYSTKYSELSDDEKNVALFATHKFEAADVESDTTTDDTTEESESSFDQRLWLMVSSIVIGAILIAVIVVIIWRRVMKKLEKARPVKVISNVPVNLEDKAPEIIEPDKVNINEIDDAAFTDEIAPAPKPSTYTKPKVYEPKSSSKNKKSKKRKY
jgi:hypothetical protein